MTHKIKETKVDLRSDTVTQPTPAMRAAMLAAPLGDDVFGDDPSVNALQDKLAGMLGFAAALFVPTGTQSNLCAILAHCQRGDEYIVGQYAHCYRWEGGGAAVFGSVQPQPLNHQSDGTLLLADIEAAIKPDDEHFARTRLLALENTLGGKLLPFDYVQRATDLAKSRGLSRHLDGARLFNAAVAQAALAIGAAPSGSSDPHEVGERGERSPAAGPSQGRAAPSGSSDPHEVGERGERSPAAGPPQGGAAPSGGSDPHEVGERGGAIHEARRIAQCFDSVSVCLSKGLGAPVGSVLCGSQDFIARAHRIRKMAGGGMRQSGLLAAAGTYALEHHVARLAEDHALIQRLAEGLSKLAGLVVEPPQTNILFVDLVGAAKARAPELIPYLAQRGILLTGLYRLRFVTHLDVDAAGIERTVAAMRDFLTGTP